MRRNHRRRKGVRRSQMISTMIQFMVLIAVVCFSLRFMTLVMAEHYDDMRYENGAFNVEGEELCYDGLIEGEHYDLWVVMESDEGDKFSPEDWTIVKVVEAE